MAAAAATQHTYLGLARRVLGLNRGRVLGVVVDVHFASRRLGGNEELALRAVPSSAKIRTVTQREDHARRAQLTG